jgi:hypothetical protein
LDTFHIRHTRDMKVEGTAIDRLLALGKVAIHYPDQKDGTRQGLDNSSTHPDNYQEGSRAQRMVRLFRRLADGGGYVCAEYNDQAGCLIGLVHPETEICLEPATWTGERAGDPAVLKTISLDKTRRLTALESAPLLICRPTQGTMAHWHAIGKRIEFLVEGLPIPFSLESLSTAEQEMMCSEFMRLPQVADWKLPRLAHLVTRPGGNMKDVDILGISTDKLPLAIQVSYVKRGTPKYKDKLARLAAFQGRKQVQLVFFCNCPAPDYENDVMLMPLQIAFDVMCSLDTFRAMFGSDF